MVCAEQIRIHQVTEIADVFPEMAKVELSSSLAIFLA
jgi:hypothetical protein